MADRYAYIPQIGIFVIMAFGVAELAEHQKSALVPSIAAAAVLVALSFATYQQIGYSQSNEDLWSHTLAVASNNFVAEDNLGGALILEGKEEQAHAHFQAAALINPKDPMSHSKLGTYDLQHGQMNGAIQKYQLALELTCDPGLLAQTYANLGAAYRAIGQTAEAQDNYDHALKLNPSQFNAWLGLGLIAQKQGKLDEAVTDLSRSVELQPTARAYLALGRALAQDGRNTEARAAYEQALKIAPDLVEARQAADALPLD